MDDNELISDNAMDCYYTDLENIDNDSYLFQQFTYDTVILSSSFSTFQYNDCITSCIGYGRFGFVYRGKECSTSKPVAVKKVLKENFKSNELKILKEIKSDYLIGFMDNCTKCDDDINMYIIMELCDIDLDRYLKYNTDDGKLSSKNLAKLMDNVIRGYNELYNYCIVHCDIKPQNILIKYKEKNLIEIAKISDFGLSRILKDEDRKLLSNIAGTLYYMAPEVGANILRTHEYGHEVDIWSLGCVFYQCIIGKVPFDEQELCRMFLFVACDNYEAYDKPILPIDIDQNIAAVINAQLEIDSSKRITPDQLYKEICK